MFGKTIDGLLQQKLKTVPSIVMERQLRHDIDELVAGVIGSQKIAVVDDADTAKVLGDTVFRALKDRFPCTHVTLKERPQADDLTVQYLRTQTLSADALVAVGSGTVNDLCKYVAHMDRKPYVVFPTAASMNGYLSANASIAQHGHKKTLLAFMPQAVFCDMEVIASAPRRLSQSGFADSLARSTAQADWLLSHLLLDTHYDDAPFELVTPLEPELFESARGIATGHFESLVLLMKTLLLSGMGMTIAGGSYPASQGEHMIAHTYEMMNRAPLQKTLVPLHGETIAVTALTMARLQEEMLHKAEHIRPDDFNSEQMIQLLGSETATQARKAFDGKMALVSHSLPDGLPGNWNDICGRIEKIRIAPDRLHALLKAAQAPLEPAAIGWHAQEYDTALHYARYTRERFTFLDLQ